MMVKNVPPLSASFVKRPATSNIQAYFFYAAPGAGSGVPKEAPKYWNNRAPTHLPLQTLWIVVALET